MAKLIIRNSAGEEREFPLADRDLRVGRGEQNDVVLPDPEKAVSRFHAELRYENGTYVLVDANSPNGVWVNGRREAEVELRPGVEALIGPYALSVESATPATETVAISAPTMVSTATPPPTRALDAPVVAATQTKTQLPGNTQPPKSASKPVWKSSNAMSIGVVVAVLLLATVVMVAGLRRRSARLAAARGHVAELPLAPAPTPPPPPPVPIEEQVRQHLEKAQSLLDDKQFNEANAELDRVDELDASNADAAVLRQKIQTALNPPPPPPPSPGVGTGTARGGPGSGRGPGTPGALPPGGQPAVDRAKGLQDRYDEGKRALLAGDYATAIRQLDQLLRDEPSYRDAAFLLEQAKMAIARDDAFAAAKKAEAAGDLVTALRMFTEAVRLGAPVQDDVNRVRQRMTTEGTTAFNEAKQFYAYGQFDRAQPLFQRAYQYLPDSDPNRKIAKERLDTMAARGRGQR